jgi:hypothetical protein
LRSDELGKKEELQKEVRRPRQYRDFNDLPITIPLPGQMTATPDGRGWFCHECGRAFADLGRHARMAHGFGSGEEYKDEYGLKRTQSLFAPALQKVFAQRLEKRDAEQMDDAQKILTLGRNNLRTHQVTARANSLETRRKRGCSLQSHRDMTQVMRDVHLARPTRKVTRWGRFRFCNQSVFVGYQYAEQEVLIAFDPDSNTLTVSTLGGTPIKILQGQFAMSHKERAIRQSTRDVTLSGEITFMGKKIYLGIALKGQTLNTKYDRQTDTLTVFAPDGSVLRTFESVSVKKKGKG